MRRWNMRMNRSDCVFLFDTIIRTHPYTCTQTSFHFTWSVLSNMTYDVWEANISPAFLVNRCWLIFGNASHCPDSRSLNVVSNRRILRSLLKFFELCRKVHPSNWRIFFEWKKSCKVYNWEEYFESIDRNSEIWIFALHLNIEISPEIKNQVNIGRKRKENKQKLLFWLQYFQRCVSRLERSAALGLQFLFTQRFHRTWFLQHFHNKIFFFIFVRFFFFHLNNKPTSIRTWN